MSEAFEASIHLLRLGRYADAWPLWKERPSRLNSPLLGSKIPEWRGESLAGRRVAIIGEQGLGDEIMFSRFVPLVKAMGPAHLTVACRPENMRAFAHLGADLVLDRLSTGSLPPTHYWTQLGSLPELFGTTPHTVPPPVPPPVKVSRGGGIGFVSRGNPDLPTDCYRSIPDNRSLPAAIHLIPTGDVLESYHQVAPLDLLVTVDTSWAHIAGTLGKPAWLLLPKLNGLCWRWMHDRIDTPWYSNMVLYRQQTDGDWAELLDRVARDLRRSRAYEPHQSATGGARA